MRMELKVFMMVRDGSGLIRWNDADGVVVGQKLKLWENRNDRSEVLLPSFRHAKQVELLVLQSGLHTKSAALVYTIELRFALYRNAIWKVITSYMCHGLQINVFNSFYKLSLLHTNIEVCSTWLLAKCTFVTRFERGDGEKRGESEGGEKRGGPIQPTATHHTYYHIHAPWYPQPV